MPLNSPRIVKEASSLVTSRLERIVARSGRKVTVSGACVDPGLLRPHAVYSLDLDGALSDSGLENARPVGWRYLGVHPDGRFDAAEVSVPGSDGAAKFSNLNYGPFVRGTETAIALAESLERVKYYNYELRLLRIPSLYVVALWAKAEDGIEDILIPIAPAPASLRPGDVYSPQEFLDLLKPDALRRKRSPSAPPPETAALQPAPHPPVSEPILAEAIVTTGEALGMHATDAIARVVSDLGDAIGSLLPPESASPPLHFDWIQIELGAGSVESPGKKVTIRVSR